MATAIAAVSLLAAGIAIWLFASQEARRIRASWRRMENLARDLCSQVHRDSYYPDIVIGVGREGAILAGIMAGNLNYRPLFVIDTISTSHPVSVLPTSATPTCCRDSQASECSLPLRALLRPGYEGGR